MPGFLASEIPGMPNVGEPAPDFKLQSTAGDLTLSELVAGSKLMLVFYTEDNTPLCASAISVLKEDYEIISALGSRVVAVSADSIESHTAFANRLGGVPFALASDPGLSVATAYGVEDGDAKRARRAVFVIDEAGVIRHAEPWFQPGNPTQYEAIFRALGFEA
jgi:peroxiredoxin Q/BCP